ncbi:MAG: hypothetical protein COA78_25550 [Blastopirellula sp.]|nr:MAG: hypothetical protein COA78_25550 [Blastopirellula sp.]
MFKLHPEFKWLAPWAKLDDDADWAVLLDNWGQAEIESGKTIANTLVKELRREMPPGHRLEKCKLKVVARCTADHNVFLLATDDPAAPLAMVHLTWKKEKDLRWPHAELFASLEDWVTQMQREHTGLMEVITRERKIHSRSDEFVTPLQFPGMQLSVPQPSHARHGGLLGCILGIIAMSGIISSATNPAVVNRRGIDPGTLFFICAFALFVFAALTATGMLIGYTIKRKPVETKVEEEFFH